MRFRTFRSYCEAQDATVAYTPGVNSGYMHPQNKSFEQAVDPLISDFSKKILTDVLGQSVVQLQPAQIEYIINKLKTELSNLHYDPNNDLGNTINALFRNKGRPAQAASTPRNQDTVAYQPQQPQQQDGSLASSIQSLFNSRRR